MTNESGPAEHSSRWADRLAKRLLPEDLRTGSLVESVRFLGTRDSYRSRLAGDEESPIFLLSAGWRSGSTLLQRLICSAPETLVWGEAFGDSIPIPRLSSGLRELGAESPHVQRNVSNLSGAPTESWIANLNPGVDELHPAHRAFLDTLFKRPAQALGYRRWGLKEVRLSGDHACYLKWAYPRAKFLFLVRHPLRSYLSYKWKRWYYVRPEHQVDNVWKFMALWGALARTFLARCREVGGHILRFEDLVRDPRCLDELSGYLELPLDRTILDKKVRGDTDHAVVPEIKKWDLAACKFFTGAQMRALGYGIRSGKPEVAEFRAATPVPSLSTPGA